MNISQISYQVGLSPKQFAKFFKEVPQNLTDEGGGVKMTVQIAQTVLLRFFGKREALHPCGCNGVAEWFYNPNALLVSVCAPFTLPTVMAMVNVISHR